MRLAATGAFVAAALLLAVPASASHHPPNSVSGGVTLSVQPGAQAGSLVFDYSVTQRPCPPLCYVNYGKPYSIAVYVDAPGGTADGVKGIPTLVNPPPHCTSATRPVIHCDTDKRSTSDPAAALPMSGSFTLVGRWVKGATAEIVVEGYSLNNYQEGVTLPPPDCSKFEAELRDANQKLTFADAKYRSRLHELVEIENAALIRFRVGELYEHLRNRAIEDFHTAQKELTGARNAVETAQKDLNDCRGSRKASMAAGPSTSAQRNACTAKKWAPLLARAKKLRLPNFGPPIKKILAERKHHKTAQAARDVNRLRAQLRIEVKALKALAKAVDACK
jgi:hypothetical protein